MAEESGVRVALATDGRRVAVRNGSRVPLTAAELAAATLVQQHDDLLIISPDGSAVQVADYFTGAVSTIVLSDATPVAPETIVAQLEPAAGTPSPEPPLPATPVQGGDRLHALLGGSEGLNALLGIRESNRGEGDAVPPAAEPSLPLPATHVPPGEAGRSQSLPTELMLSPAPVVTTTAEPAVEAETDNVAATTTAPPEEPASIPAVAPTFHRTPLAVQSGEPGDAKPNIVALPQLGTSGSDIFTQFNAVFTDKRIKLAWTDAAQTSITLEPFNAINPSNPSDAPAVTFSVAEVRENGNLVTFEAGFGVRTFDLGNLLDILPSYDELPEGWWLPIADTYSGLESNDTVNWLGGPRDVIFGGSGQDLLLGDYDNLPGARRLTQATADDAVTAPPANDFMMGGRGADTIYGGGGYDTLRGDDGDDLIIVPDLAFQEADGGAGGSFVTDSDNLGLFPKAPPHVQHAIDILELAGTGLTLSFPDVRVVGFEAIDLSLNAHNVLRIAPDFSSVATESVGDVLAPSASIFVLGDHTDTVQLLGGGWTLARSDIPGDRLEINAPGTMTFAQYTNVDPDAGIEMGRAAPLDISLYVHTAIEVQFV